MFKKKNQRKHNSRSVSSSNQRSTRSPRNFRDNNNDDSPKKTYSSRSQSRERPVRDGRDGGRSRGDGGPRKSYGSYNSYSSYGSSSENGNRRSYSSRPDSSSSGSSNYRSSRSPRNFRDNNNHDDSPKRSYSPRSQFRDKPTRGGRDSGRNQSSGYNRGDGGSRKSYRPSSENGNRRPYSSRPDSNLDKRWKSKPRGQYEPKQDDKRYHIIGIQPIEEAIRKGVKFNRLYLQKQDKENFDRFIDYCKAQKINFFFIEKKELDKKSGGQNHQGVVAELMQETRVIPDLKEYLDKNLNPNRSDVVLILDRITDQQNVGAIARSAYFFGCRLIISERSHSAPIDSVVHKTSSGASLMVAFHLTDKMTTTVDILKESGYEILAATSKEAIPLNQLSPRDSTIDSKAKNYAVILGSEGKGVRPHLERLADQRITIPRLTNFDSLNVSVATGIILYAMSESGMIGLDVEESEEQPKIDSDNQSKNEVEETVQEETVQEETKDNDSE